MKNLIIFLIIFVFKTSILFAQEPTIVWSEEFKEWSDIYGSRLVATQDKFYLVNKNIKEGIDMYNVDIYDKQLKYIKNTSINNQNPYKDKKHKDHPAFIYGVNNSIYYSSIFNDQSGRVSEGYTYKIKDDNNVLSAENIKQVGTKELGFMYIIQSPDKSKILYLGYKKTGPQEYIAGNNAIVIDKDGTIIWQGDLSITSLFKNVDYEQICLTNNGDIVLLCSFDKKYKIIKPQSYDYGYKYTVITYSWKTKKVVEQNLNFNDDKICTKPKVEIDNEGNIQVAQFVIDKIISQPQPAYQYLVYDINLKEKKKHLNYLSPENFEFPLIKNSSVLQAQEDVILLERTKYQAKNILTTASGNTLIIFEKRVAPKDDQNYRCDIIVACHDNQGKLIWNTIIARNVNASEEYKNFIPTVKGEDLYILYNDDFRNINITNGKELAVLNLLDGIIIIVRPMIVLAKINPKGELIKKGLEMAESKAGSFIYVAKNGSTRQNNWVDNPEGLYFASVHIGKSNKYRIGKIQFK
ncbi:MAG: hypothetical protein V4608_16260 [Bacteroidota bacterium]